MHYTYVLIDRKKNLYIGYTQNLRRRFDEHNSGNGGVYSKKHRPFILVYYEAFISKIDAMKQEKFYKTGYGREVLHGKIADSISKIG